MLLAMIMFVEVSMFVCVWVLEFGCVSVFVCVCVDVPGSVGVNDDVVVAMIAVMLVAILGRKPRPCDSR